MNFENLGMYLVFDGMALGSFDCKQGITLSPLRSVSVFISAEKRTSVLELAKRVAAKQFAGRQLALVA